MLALCRGQVGIIRNSAGINPIEQNQDASVYASPERVQDLQSWRRLTGDEQSIERRCVCDRSRVVSALVGDPWLSLDDFIPWIYCEFDEFKIAAACLIGCSSPFAVVWIWRSIRAWLAFPPPPIRLLHLI